MSEVPLQGPTEGPRRSIECGYLSSQGDLRMQGYEASKVGSLKPRKHIDAGALRAQVATSTVPRVARVQGLLEIKDTHHPRSLRQVCA